MIAPKMIDCVKGHHLLGNDLPSVCETAAVYPGPAIVLAKQLQSSRHEGGRILGSVGLSRGNCRWLHSVRKGYSEQTLVDVSLSMAVQSRLYLGIYRGGMCQAVYK